jgi:hypothetical protein
MWSQVQSAHSRKEEGPSPSQETNLDSMLFLNAANSVTELTTDYDLFQTKFCLAMYLVGEPSIFCSANENMSGITG